MLEKLCRNIERKKYETMWTKIAEDISYAIPLMILLVNNLFNFVELTEENTTVFLLILAIFMITLNGIIEMFITKKVINLNKLSKEDSRSVWIGTLRVWVTYSLFILGICFFMGSTFGTNA